MSLSSMWEIADRSSGVADGLRTGETQRNQQVITEKCSGHFENISWRYSVSLLRHYYQWVRAGGLVIKHKGLVSPPLSTLEMDPLGFLSRRAQTGENLLGVKTKLSKRGKQRKRKEKVQIQVGDGVEPGNLRKWDTIFLHTTWKPIKERALWRQKQKQTPNYPELPLLLKSQET